MWRDRLLAFWYALLGHLGLTIERRKPDPAEVRQRLIDMLAESARQDAERRRKPSSKPKLH